MTTLFQVAIIIIWTILLGCNSHSKKTKNASPTKDTAVIRPSEPLDTPRHFVRNYGVNDNNKLFVFVGQKIWVQPLASMQHSFDNRFKAKYLILENVFGDFPADTIEFVAYDHYGIPAFSKYKNTLLFVSADSGTYYQQKYMYNDVYKTKDGRWAGTYAADDYGHDYNKYTKIKPVKIDFAETVTYPTRMPGDDGKELTFLFPKPYFEINGGSAIAVYGNYVDDLFKLKRDGYLTAREIFKNGKLVQ